MGISKSERRLKMRRRIRKKIQGTAEKPRLCVFRSNKGIYAQIINDVEASTLCEANGMVSSGKTKIDVAKQTGLDLASKAKDAGIENVVFDRGGYLYHGRVKALAEGAREGGLKF